MIKIDKKNKGFVLLFAVLLTSIILSVSLGIANIALKEMKFGTSAKETNNAFFAADVGAECALYYDRSNFDRFRSPNPGTQIPCGDNNTILPTFSSDANAWSYNFNIVTNLTSTVKSCVKVNIIKTSSTTRIISKGYNNGGSPVDFSCVQGFGSVERVLELNY